MLQSVSFSLLSNELVCSFTRILHNERGYMSTLWKNIKNVDEHLQIKHIPTCYSHKNLFIAIKALTTVMFDINAKIKTLQDKNVKAFKFEICTTSPHVFTIQQCDITEGCAMTKDRFTFVYSLASGADVSKFYKADIKWILFLLSLSMFRI